MDVILRSEAKEQLSQQLELQVQAFLANGGTIKTEGNPTWEETKKEIKEKKRRHNRLERFFSD